MSTAACDNTAPSNNPYDASIVQDESTDTSTDQDKTTANQDQTATDESVSPLRLIGFVKEVTEAYMLFDADNGTLYRIDCPEGRFKWFANKRHWKFRVKGIVTDEIDGETGAVVFEIEWYYLDTDCPETFTFGLDYDHPMTVTGSMEYISMEGGFYGFIGDDGNGYFIGLLPEEYKIDGLRIKVTFVFSRDIGYNASVLWGENVEYREVEVL